MKVAFISCEGFEKSELLEVKKHIEEAGLGVQVFSAEKDKKKLRSWEGGHWGKSIDVDAMLEDANHEDFDAIVIPGGVINADKLRRVKAAQDWATEFLKSGKIVAAICHGPQLLIETKMLKGRTMTSYPAIRTDLENAGVQWEDSEVVVDQGLVTSRKPADNRAFALKIVEEVKEGEHRRSLNKSAAGLGF